MFIYSFNTTLSPYLSTPLNQPCLYPEKDSELNLTLNPEKMDAGQNKYFHLWYWQHLIVHKPLCVMLYASFKGTVSVILSDPPCKRWQYTIYNGTLETFI